MKLKMGTSRTNLQQLNRTIKCPYCRTDMTTLPRNSGICPLCGGKPRMCPYCGRLVRESEDPCHSCGHLEPAASSPEGGMTAGDGSFGGNRLDYLFLILGIAMMIWPNTYNSNSTDCGSGEMIGCFIDTAWGVATGVTLVTISIFEILWSIFAKSRRKEV